ncbi:MAG: long-chain fatty acid--CoA ligase [Deltaproteobacteria bacterium]|nr:long-chain fatty acid--CoA ligase [Deltaproteobacteria bacterium]
MEERVWHKSYDEGVTPSIEYEDTTLRDMLAKSARSYPNATAMVFMNMKMSYARLKDEVDRLATALSEMGVKKDSRVAVQLPNLPQTIIAYQACQVLGAQAVMTNPLYMPREIEHQWHDASVEVAVVADFIFASKIEPMRAKLPAKQYVVASIPEYLRFPLNLLAPLKLKKAQPQPLIAKVAESDSVHHFRKLLGRTEPRPPKVDIAMDDLAALQYTGGTTGVAKGAMLTQRNLSYNAQQARAWFPAMKNADEVFLAALPYFHSFGMQCCMNLPIFIAATMVVLPNPRDIPAMMKALCKHRVTMMPAVPAIFNAILNHPEVGSFDLSSIKSCFSGSAPLPVEVLERFEKMTGAKIAEGFGLTETSPVTHVNPFGGVRKIGSIGIPVPDTDCRIVDIEDGKTDKAVGEEGEIIIKGPQVMKGYWNMPGETAGMIREGWLYTGDLATMDAEGYFKIVGRKKDMIIVGGYNVYPDEVDGVLMMHDAVLEAATIGVPEEKKGERVKSFVVFKPGRKASFEELEKHCKDNLAAYKVPKLWEERAELPKSTVLKVLRRELRDEELKKSKKGD